jgi:hypothetical protein
VTGSFSIIPSKMTGNLEFHSARAALDRDRGPAHSRLTGEGRTQGPAITGAAWYDRSRVTGTEAETAAERNPSRADGKPQAFSGTRRFKLLAKREDARQMVTGLVGWSGKTAARVTLSGGAQG